jgi:hypothetical protein
VGSCPVARCGGKVEQSTPFPALLLAPADIWEGYLTSRLRELIQQLGEAIHESVIESEQIAGVVQDIRRHGFDVLLMLEATIGLNEVTAKDAEEGEASLEAGGRCAFRLRVKTRKTTRARRTKPRANSAARIPQGRAGDQTIFGLCVFEEWDGLGGFSDMQFEPQAFAVCGFGYVHQQ